MKERGKGEKAIDLISSLSMDATCLFTANLVCLLCIFGLVALGVTKPNIHKRKILTTFVGARLSYVRPRSMSCSRNLLTTAYRTTVSSLQCCHVQRSWLHYHFQRCCIRLRMGKISIWTRTKCLCCGDGRNSSSTISERR